MDNTRSEIVHADESTQTRAVHILEVFNETDARKSELTSQYAKAIGEYIHRESGHLKFLTDPSQEKDVDVKGGLVVSKSAEALEAHLMQGYRRDEELAEIFSQDFAEVTQEQILAAFSLIVPDVNPAEFVREYSGGLSRTEGNEFIGCGGAYGSQMNPRSTQTGNYNREIQNNSYLSRTLLHMLNYGAISAEGTINSTAVVPPLEIHMADQPFDPIVPFEFHTSKFFNALKNLSSYNKTEIANDAEVQTVRVDNQGEIIHIHGELAGHAEVSIARLKLLAENNLKYPVVIHAHEPAVAFDNNGAEQVNPQESLTKIAVAAIQMEVPIVIENNKYTQDGLPVYHTGKEFGAIIKSVVSNAYSELSTGKSHDEQDEIRAKVNKYVGVTLDFAHFNCAPPHLGQRYAESRNMLTPSKKSQLTTESVEDALEALDELAASGFTLENLHLHIGQNADKGKDIHLATLAGFGNVPNTECYGMVMSWAADRKDEYKLNIRTILEQTGEVFPDDVEALVRGERTGLEKASEICPVRILANNPEIVLGEFAKLEESALLSIDIPRWTEINAGGIEDAREMHELTIEYRKEIAGMIESGMYGSTFLLAAAGDETSIALNISKDAEQDKIRAFMLAIDSQLVFWELLEKPEYSMLREKYYNEPPLLHVGVSVDKNLFAQMLPVGESVVFCPSGGAFSAKGHAKEQGLEFLLEQAALEEDLTQLMDRFFSERTIREQVSALVTPVEKDSVALQKQTKLYSWRERISQQVTAPPLSSRRISDLAQNDDFESLVPILAEMRDELAYVPEDLVSKGEVFFGRLVGLDEAVLGVKAQLAQNTETSVELIDAIESIIGTHVGAYLLAEMSSDSWVPREVEYDKDPSSNGVVNILATSGIFNPEAVNSLPNASSLVNGLEKLRAGGGWQEVNSVIKKNILSYLRHSTTKLSEADLDNALNLVNIGKLNVCGAFVELDGASTFAFAESPDDREGAYSGTLHLSGTAMPLAARMALRASQYYTGESILVSNKSTMLTAESEEVEYANLKGFGNVNVHITK